MKINEMWMNAVLSTLGESTMEAKQILLANKLHKELADKPLSQVLAEHLPASESAQLATDAGEMQRSVAQMYDGLGKQVTPAWAEARLNRSLDGHTTDEQGKWLVNLIHCSTAVKPVSLEENTRWQQLKRLDTFGQQDVADLVDMAHDCIDHSAGFLASQQFMVMEKSLHKLSADLVETQMNSGTRYAEAYAAAMYISSKQNGTLQSITPAQMGLLAANSVESCRLLSMYHYGKLRMEEAMPKLKDLAKAMLTIAGEIALNLMAAGVYFGATYLACNCLYDMMTAMAITNTTVLAVVILGFAALAVLDYNHEETVECLRSVIEDIQTAVRNIANFFIGLFSKAPSQTQTVEASQSVKVISVHTNPHSVKA